MRLCYDGGVLEGLGSTAAQAYAYARMCQSGCQSTYVLLLCALGPYAVRLGRRWLESVSECPTGSPLQHPSPPLCPLCPLYRTLPCLLSITFCDFGRISHVRDGTEWDTDHRCDHRLRRVVALLAVSIYALSAAARGCWHVRTGGPGQCWCEAAPCTGLHPWLP